MKRSLVIALTVLMCIGLALAGFGSWCLGTTAGARWLLSTAGKVAGIGLTTTELDGSLLGGLDLKELRIAWNGGEIQADTLKLALHQSRLWSGVLAIDELVINRLILQIDHADNAQAVTSANQTTAVSLAVAPEWLEVTIDRLQVTDFVYRSASMPTNEVVIASRIAGQYRLAEHRLVARNFAYHSPYVELDGDFDWELTQPHLVMTANVLLPETCVDPELFDKIAVPTAFPGHLELDGDWNGYHGPVLFGVNDETGRRVWLSALATGSWSGIRFDDLKGRYLGGTLAGDLDLAWIDSYRMHGQLSVKDLDPSILSAETTGQATFDASGELLVPYDGQPLLAKVATVLHDGQFRGHHLQGRAAAQWRGQSLVDIDVDLAGDGAHLLAKGVPAQRVDVDIDVGELATFHSDLSGQAAARGWLSWSDESIAGEIDGHAENLGWQEIKFRTVTFQGRHRAGDEQVTLTLSGENWSRGTYRLQRVAGELSGTLSAHQLKLDAVGSAGHFTALASGSYRTEHWSGRLERLVGDDTPWGRWSMPHATPLQWDQGVTNIGDLQLHGEAGAQLKLAVQQWGSPGQASVTLDLSGFELAWLQPYAEFGNLTGHAAGHWQYTMSAGQPLSIGGQLTAGGRIEDDYFELAYEGLDLNFRWDQGGLQVTGTARSDAGERLQVSATAPGPLAWAWPIAGLTAELQWQEFKLERLNRFLQDGQFEGLSEGNLALAFTGERLAEMTGHLAIQGRLMQGARELGPRSLTAELNWSSRHFQCTAKLAGARGGHASVLLTSTQAVALAWPDSGEIELEAAGLSFAALEPFLPQNIEIAGTVNGSAAGTWGSKGTVDLSGQVQLQDTQVGWTSEDGQIRLPLRDAVAEWSWADESLTGIFAMNLAEHGDIKGTWQLPLPARIPAAIDPDGRLQMTVEGKMQAIGLLSAIGPWLMQDVSGETQLNLAVHGTWADPELRGSVAIKDGSAYLPITGVQLEDFQLRGELAGDRLLIDNLMLRSGTGDLTGQGEVVFDRWKLASYRLDITGKDLKVVDFPELQMTCNPDLDISGTPDRLSIQGSALIPMLAIRESKAAPEVMPSKDVLLAKEEKSRQDLNFDTDILVVVDLGDDVTYKSGGVYTRLSGGAVLTMGPTGELLTQGEIQLVSGSYRAHGVNLKIRQGILSYKGGVITNPNLRIFAAREVGEVLAGVQVTGNAEAPVVTLYSRPAMPERDILGYMLMGRAINTDSQESDMLMMGAGSLMPGYGGVLADLGITEIDIQGLFTGTGGVRLRRKFTDNWEVESTLGVESGIDLFYIIEFE
jgi:translocation and assembly module TamB